MRNIYFVDLAMCGGDDLPEGFELDDFCERLQGKLPGVEVVPVVGERAVNRDSRLVSHSVFHEALGEYCHL